MGSNRHTGQGRLAALILGAASLLIGAHVNADVITGLAARYDFASTPTVGTDSSPNGNNGTLSATNSTWFNDATRGGVLKLTPSGGPGYLLVPDSASLAITGDMTVSAWVNITDFSTYNGIIGKTTGNIPNPYDFYLVQTTGIPNFFRGNGGGFGNSTGTAAPATLSWHLISVTQSGTAVTHYLDGVVNGTGTLSTTITNNAAANLYIGSRSDSATAFNGLIDDVRIYNRALSAGDITEIYTGVPEPVSICSLGAAGLFMMIRRPNRR